MGKFFKRNAQEPNVIAQEPKAVERATSIPKVPRRSYSARPAGAVRQHDAATTDRLTSNWTTTPLTADQVVDRNQRVLVARSREQAASNDYMKAFIRQCSQNIVGHRGFALQAQASKSKGDLDRDANEALETWWRKWCRAENCDIKGQRSFRRICQTAVKTAAKDGEFFIREIKGRAAGPFRYALQTIDPQRCPVEYNVEGLTGGRFIRQGIEFSREGRPLAYFFMVGEAANSAYTTNGSNLERVPANQIIHGFLEDIEGQRRGIPWAATSLWRLHMLSGFEKAALTNARMGASVGGFIQWKDGEGPDPEDAENPAEDEELYIEAEGGVFQELPAGAEAKPFPNTYPSGELAQFNKAVIRGAGAGMGVSYVSLANDLEGVNFSSIRYGVLNERDHWMDLQEWLLETLIDRCYQSALEPSMLLGLIHSKGRPLPAAQIDRYRRVYWQGRRWAWVDPTKDVKAEVDAKNNLLTSPSEIIRRRGDDPDTTWRTYAADIQGMRDAGMPESFIMAAVLGVQPNPTPPPKNKSEDDPNGKDGSDDE